MAILNDFLLRHFDKNKRKIKTVLANDYFNQLNTTVKKLEEKVDIDAIISELGDSWKELFPIDNSLEKYDYLNSFVLNILTEYCYNFESSPPKTLNRLKELAEIGISGPHPLNICKNFNIQIENNKHNIESFFKP